MQIKSLFISLILFLPLAATSSDGAMFCANPARTGLFLTTPLNSSPSVTWENDQRGSSFGSIATTNNAVYLVSNQRQLLSFNRESGAIIWSDILSSAFSGSGPAVDETADILVVGTGSTGVRAYQASTGNVLWNFTTEGVVYSSPVIDGAGNTYFTDSSGYAYSLVASTGVQNWMVQLGSSIVASPALSSTSVFIATLGGAVISLNSTDGSQNWSRSIGQQIRATTPVANGFVLVADGHRRLFALDEANGDINWQTSILLNPITTPATDGQRVYVVDILGAVHALDLTTGTSIWVYKMTGQSIAPPILAGTTLYVVSERGELVALNAQTGGRLWSFDGNASVTSQPTVRDGRFYLSTALSTYAFE